MNRNEPVYATIALFVAQLRKEQGITQKELAQKVYVSDKAVSKLERGNAHG